MVVIGGGIIGVTAALNLARWQIPVVLLEKGLVAAEQSSRNWGWVRMQGRSQAEVPLMQVSREQWLTINDSLDTDIGLRQRGTTYMSTDARQLERYAQFMQVARQYKLDTRELNSRELLELLGPAASGMTGGLHTPSDYVAEPTLAVPAIARLAQSAGAQIFEQCAVRTLELAGGRISGVVTEHGVIGCEHVLLAGGAWCRTFLENLGMQLPQLAVLSSAQRTSAARMPFASAVGAPGVSIRQRLDGGVTIGQVGVGCFDVIPAALRHFFSFYPLLRAPDRQIRVRIGRGFLGPLGRRRWDASQVSPFEKTRILNPQPDTRQLDKMLHTAGATFAELRDVKPVQRWGGLIDVTPDELPIIDHVARLPGLTLAAGFSGHGFGLGPGAGLLAAQLCTQRDPAVSAQPFRLDRFDKAAS